MSTTVRFFKTNNINDTGFELEATEVAKQFWESDDGKAWAAEPHGRLEGVAMAWVSKNIGGWENGLEDWNPVGDAILDTMPRK